MGYEVHNLNNGKKTYVTNKQAETMLSDEILKIINLESNVTTKEKQLQGIQIDVLGTDARTDEQTG